MVEEVTGGSSGGGEGGDEGNDTVGRGEAPLEVEERSYGFGEAGEEVRMRRGFGSEERQFLELSVVRGV